MGKRRTIYRSKKLKKSRRRRLWFKRIRFLIMLVAFAFLCSLIYRSFIVKDINTKRASAVTQTSGRVQVGKSGTQPDAGMQNGITWDDKITTENSRRVDINPLKTAIVNYLKGFEGKYGVYFYNLVTGDEFGINENDKYTAASTIKVPLNLYLYTQIQAGVVDADSLLTYTRDDYEGGTGSLQYKAVGTRYSIRELSKLSIEQSDNVAANILFRFLGKKNVKDYMTKVGGSVVDDEENISCPKDMGLYMKLVYRFYLNGGTLGNELMNSFMNTDFDDRIPALLPDDVKVAHKIGTQVHVINDVGIVFADTPFIISIMSDGVDETEAPDVIANISKKIYDFVAANFST